MAGARMPDAFFAELETLLPAEEPMGPEGGSPRVPHRAVIKVLWYVLVTGCRWEDVPLELGCSGRTAHRRLQRRNEAGVWDDLHMHFLALLRRAGILEAELAIVDSVMVRAFGGGDATGPSPVDRRKLGTKHTLARTISRASHVEPDLDGYRWADMGPVEGPALGPFRSRSGVFGGKSVRRCAANFCTRRSPRRSPS